MNNPFLRQKDPVEHVVFLMGCFLVIMVAFFIARGDLDAYTGFLLGTSLQIEDVPGERRAADLLTELERLARPADPTTVPGFQEGEVAPAVGPVEQIIAPAATGVPAAPVPTPVTVSTPPVPVAAASPTPAPVIQAPSGAFFVQAGAFSRRENADRMLESLRQLGFQPVLRQDAAVFKVQIPGLPSLEEARRIVQQLRNQGIESFAGQ
ncbi:MAG TPA: SPOR domain-containing protein [Atribacteraceae bacterium]|nr:SPOR domain-containing protein [Atribacteraceae bacterium]